MTSESLIQLKTSSILNLPLDTYGEDFSFIVNEEEFKTSRLVADILSPNILKIHSTDPTSCKYIVNTKQQGDFSRILQLVNFESYNISTEELGFICEVIEKLGNNSFEITESTKITKENVFTLLKFHEKNPQFYSKRIESEIEFISINFFEICDTQKEEIEKLNEKTIIQIISSPKLQLNDEDQLLRFINGLIQKDEKFNDLYEYVHFLNVSIEAMKEFNEIFDFNQLNGSIWISLSKRLISESIQKVELNGRYKITEEPNHSKISTFSHTQGNEFNGIVSYLTKKTGGNIHSNGTIELKSNCIRSNPIYHPKNLLNFDTNDFYMTCGNRPEPWISFDFKNFEVEIASYSIMSGPSAGYVKNWLIEISDDELNWSTIDEHQNYVELNGPNIVRSFDVKKNHFARYVRFKHVGEYWTIENNLRIASIEFYGRLKEK